MRRLLASLILLAVAVAPAAGAEPEAQRVGGTDRIDTAAALAQATFDEASYALLASAEDYPDALAGAALAGTLTGPVLLTDPVRLPARTRQTLEDLGVERVLLLGGSAAVADTVEAELVAHGYDTERVAGANRYATAAAIAERTAGRGVQRVFVASGETFADALVAGPAAYALRAPILLSRRDGLPEETVRALEDLDPAEAIILGGEAAVSAAVATAIEQRGSAVVRVAGSERAETAARFADVAVAHLGFDPARVLLARGDGFADALAAAPRGGELPAPILLAASPDTLGRFTQRWLTRFCEQIATVEAVGGPDAIEDEILARAVEVVGRCGLSERTFTYSSGVRGAVESDLEEFRRVTDATLNDPRGWGLDGAIDFVEVTEEADFRLWLASPQAVESAAAVCHRSWSCRVGNDVYINDLRWREATTTYHQEGRSLGEYRSYVLNHEVGHWLGLRHWGCPGAGHPAPVMQQQSIRLDGCHTNVWPVEAERDAVRHHHLPG
jgi:putative cell wall-binding protein